MIIAPNTLQGTSTFQNTLTTIILMKSYKNVQVNMPSHIFFGTRQYLHFPDQEHRGETTYPRSHGKSAKQPTLETRSPGPCLVVCLLSYFHSHYYLFSSLPPFLPYPIPYKRGILPDTAIVSLIHAMEKIQSLCPSLESRE